MEHTKEWQQNIQDGVSKSDADDVRCTNYFGKQKKYLVQHIVVEFLYTELTNFFFNCFVLLVFWSHMVLKVTQIQFQIVIILDNFFFFIIIDQLSLKNFNKNKKNKKWVYYSVLKRGYLLVSNLREHTYEFQMLDWIKPRLIGPFSSPILTENGLLSMVHEKKLTQWHNTLCNLRCKLLDASQFSMMISN